MGTARSIRLIFRDRMPLGNVVFQTCKAAFFAVRYDERGIRREVNCIRLHLLRPLSVQ